MVDRDEVDGIHLDMTKIEWYLKQLILWILILIMKVLVISLVSIAVWNFLARPHKDVSGRVIDKLLSALNSDNLAGVVAEGASGRYSATSTILRMEAPQTKV